MGNDLEGIFLYWFYTPYFCLRKSLPELMLGMGDRMEWKAQATLLHEAFTSLKGLLLPPPPLTVHFTGSKNTPKPFKPSSPAAASLLDD